MMVKLFESKYALRMTDKPTNIIIEVIVDIVVSGKELDEFILEAIVYRFIEDYVFNLYPPIDHPRDPENPIILEYYRGTEELEELKQRIFEIEWRKFIL